MKNARLLIQDLITVFERMQKKVNEMFIIIEFILLAETLENTVPDSTVRPYTSVRSFVHWIFFLSHCHDHFATQQPHQCIECGRNFSKKKKKCQKTWLEK